MNLCLGRVDFFLQHSLIGLMHGWYEIFLKNIFSEILMKIQVLSHFSKTLTSASCKLIALKKVENIVKYVGKEYSIFDFLKEMTKNMINQYKK